MEYQLNKGIQEIPLLGGTVIKETLLENPEIEYKAELKGGHGEIIWKILYKGEELREGEKYNLNTIKRIYEMLQLDKNKIEEGKLIISKR